MTSGGGQGIARPTLQTSGGVFTVEIQISGVTFKDMKHADRITFNPSQCGGRPCVRGMRIRVKDVLEMLASGVSETEMLEDFPYLEADDIRACLEYAANEVGHPVLVAEA